MKTISIVTYPALLALATLCNAQQPPADPPETVMATFRVRSGKEAEFAKALEQAWPSYRRAGMVSNKPHLVVQDVDETGAPYFVEILTWKSHHAPDQAPAEIRALWPGSKCCAKGAKVIPAASSRK